MGGTQAVAGLIATLLLAGCGRSGAIVVGSKNFTEQVILGEIVAQHIESRTLGIFGEPRVNVLELNLALDSTGTQ